MVEKRYQVFVSSTFRDLIEERKEVTQALLELDCIPCGMELFPAANEDQWTLIKKVIDDCDYYLVIIAGRYGSLGPEGLSFTEMEYRYALAAKKPIIGFVHEDISKLPAGSVDLEQEKRDKLSKFSELVKSKMVKFWKNPADLGSAVSRSLVQLTKTHPAMGWVRANNVPDESSAQEILKLRKEIDRLKADHLVRLAGAPIGIENLVQGDDEFEIKCAIIYKHKPSGSSLTKRIKKKWQCKITMNQVIAAASPSMIHDETQEAINDKLDSWLLDQKFAEAKNAFPELQIVSVEFTDQSFETLIIQMSALGIIEKSGNNRQTCWHLTPYGETTMYKLRALKKSDLLKYENDEFSPEDISSTSDDLEN